MSYYQTVPLPHDDWIDGVFPTIHWFSAINQVVSFQDKTVLDLGCCSFSYGVQAINNGAKFVTGVERVKESIDHCQYVIGQWGFEDKTRLICDDIEEISEYDEHDIVIFSVVIHHLKEPEKTIRKLLSITTDKLVLVYRYPHEGVDEPGYRPTFTELSVALGKLPFHTSFISTTKKQNIALAVYDKSI
jgi:SAM-dependent methyltransferase